MNVTDAPPPWMNEEIWQETWGENPDYFFPDHWVALYLTTVDPTLAHLREQAEARLMSLTFSFAEVLDYLGDPDETITAYSVENITVPSGTWADAATMIADRDLLALLILTGEWLKAHGGRLHELEVTLVSLRGEAEAMDRALETHAQRIRELLALEPPWDLQERLPFLLPEILRLSVPAPRGPWASLVTYPTRKP